MRFKEEEDVQDWLINIIKKKGWTVEKEVPTDETKHKTYLEKIDLIIFKSKYPQLDPIGIELKYIVGIRKGSIISQAMEQLLFKYAKSHFKSLKLKTLCIGIYYEMVEGANERNAIIQSSHVFTRGLLNYWGIGYLNLNENPLRIYFGAENPKGMIMNIMYVHSNLSYNEAYEKRYIVNEDKILKNSRKWHKFIK